MLQARQKALPDGGDPGQGRRRGTEGVGHPLNGFFFPFRLNENPLLGVDNGSGDAKVFCQAIDKGAETNALDSALDGNLHPDRFEKILHLRCYYKVSVTAAYFRYASFPQKVRLAYEVFFLAIVSFSPLRNYLIFFCLNLFPVNMEEISPSDDVMSFQITM